jgi:arabinogalactan oligomer/maltooligosaccharide transport system substrate-binding protein
MPEHSPQSLGRYTIHAELGKGGFATVYRAIDTTLERDVALKILKPGWTDDAKAVERFMREAKQASRLKHANIVTIYDVGQVEGRLFIAMELVRGRSLQQIIAEDGTLPWARVLAILEQSASALDYAHAEGLVHRDIKPANIILDESKPGSAVHVMLTDFGLVRGAEQASLSMGTTGGLLGTPEYISPEIWDGEPATKASDIYALGCVAFYLLTGKVLFSATTPMAVLKRHAEGPIFPQQWPSGVPAGAEAVLCRALAKDPNQRQASAAELAAELRACEEQAAREQAAREQAAREQEAKQKEEVQHAMQAALALEAARKAREEQKQQRQAELAAQATAEKAKQETAERERQRQAREAAKLAEEEARRKELATAQQPVVAKADQRPQTAPHLTKTKSNRTWLYVAGGVIAVIVIGILFASTNPFAPEATPAPPPPETPAAQPTESPLAPSEGPAAVAVNLALWTTESGDQLTLAKAVIAECAQTIPGLTVDVVNYDYEKLRDIFQTSAQAGPGPNLLWTVNDHAGPFATADLIDPVDNIGIDLSHFVPGALEPVALNGQHWGIPLSYGTNLMLMYNKKLVDHAPADTDEMIQMAKNFAAAHPGSYGLAFNLGEPFWLVPWLGGFGGKVFAEDGKTPTLNTPEMVKALQLVSDFKTKDKIVPQECDYFCADSLFKDGKATMIINGDWSLNDYASNQNIDLGTAPFPKITGADYPKPFTAGRYIIFPKSQTEDQRAAALNLTQCLISDEVQLRWLKEQKRMPAVQRLFDDPLIINDPILAGSAADLLNGTGIPPATEMRCNWDAMKPPLDNVLAGKMTPEEAAAAMQASAESCVANLK